MKASPGLMIYAKVMLGIFVGLGIFSIVMTIRFLLRKSDPDPKKLAAAKRGLLFSSWLLIPVIGNAIKAVTTQEYWLLLVSSLLFSYLLPLIVLYFKTRAALKRALPT